MLVGARYDIYLFDEVLVTNVLLILVGAISDLYVFECFYYTTINLTLYDNSTGRWANGTAIVNTIGWPRRPTIFYLT